MKNATDVSGSVQGREPEREPALVAGALLIGFEGITSSCVFMVTPFRSFSRSRARIYSEQDQKRPRLSATRVRRPRLKWP